MSADDAHILSAEDAHIIMSAVTRHIHEKKAANVQEKKKQNKVVTELCKDFVITHRNDHDDTSCQDYNIGEKGSER